MNSLWSLAVRISVASYETTIRLVNSKNPYHFPARRCHKAARTAPKFAGNPERLRSHNVLLSISLCRIETVNIAMAP